MTPYWQASDVTLHQGDARTIWRDLPEHSAHAIITSPPYYGLRDYGVDGQLGLESSPGEYVEALADLLTGWGERVLRPDGSLWLNLGDTYAAPGAPTYYDDQSDVGGRGGGHGSAHRARRHGDHPAKCLLMIPERVALALIDRGWILRNRIVWAKPNGMPSSVTDRLATKHEALFHLVRQPRYSYDLDAIRVPHSPHTAKYYRDRPGKRYTDYNADLQKANSGGLQEFRSVPEAGANPGDVWTIPTQPYPEAHFAVFPPELVRRPILATVPEGGTVADPFAGAGTTAVMARRLGRRSLLCELNSDYCDLIARRLRQDVLLFGDAP